MKQSYSECVRVNRECAMTEKPGLVPLKHQQQQQRLPHDVRPSQTFSSLGDESSEDVHDVKNGRLPNPLREHF